ncbi:MAG: phosphoribosyltransferase family protein [Actinomycetota bacterium]
MPFADRRDAGSKLAAVLEPFRSEDPVVVGLPRGGVPVAAEVAMALDAPLDVLVVRKLGCPWQPELGVGAVGEDGIRVVNNDLVALLGIASEDLEAVAQREEAEVARRLERYRAERPAVPVRGRTVILVDDGLATGFTARAGIEVLRLRGAKRVVVAVPVAPPAAVQEIRSLADDVVVLESPAAFLAIGAWYRDFTQTTDEDVARLLARGEPEPAPVPAAGTDDPPVERALGVGRLGLPGTLTVPPEAAGVVVFAHGSGSSRLSPRNLAVAQVLNQGGLATLLFDLLTPVEERDRRNVFDIELLAARLEEATRWLRDQPAVDRLPVGFFGASTGAAAALWTAAKLGDDVGAVVSRGGRPDLALERLPSVTAPTLLIVGGHDEVVPDLNREAERRLRCVSRVAVVPGATHLFDEPGALEAVAALARDWFARYLRSAVPAHGRPRPGLA